MKDKIEKLLGTRLPPRLAKFWGTGEHQKHSRRMISGLPNYTKSSSFEVRFDDLRLFHDFEELKSELGRNAKRFLPLTRLEDEPQFLAVDASIKDHPVVIWEHGEGTFTPVAPSLDSFLKTLRARGEEPSFKRLIREYASAFKLYQQAKHKPGLKLLERALAPFPSETIGDASDNILRSAYRLRGRFRIALKQPRAALPDFHWKVGNAWLDLLDAQYVAGDFKGLLQNLKKEKDVSYFLLYRGLASWHLGKRDEALKLFAATPADFGPIDEPRYWLVLRAFVIDLEKLGARVAPMVAALKAHIAASWSKPGKLPSGWLARANKQLLACIAEDPWDEFDDDTGDDFQIAQLPERIFERSVATLAPHLAKLDPGELVPLLGWNG
jgi:hypothetical protein